MTVVHLYAERPERAVVPFAAVAALGVLSLLLPPYSDPQSVVPVVIVCMVVVVLLSLVLARFPRTHWVMGAPPILFFGVVAWLRHVGGGEYSGLIVLIGLPILWVVLYGTRAQLWLCAVAAAATLLLPIVLIGPPLYDSGDWRRALIWILLITAICPILQESISELRTTREAERRIANQLTAVLRAAVEHSIVATDDDGTITLFSQGAERMLGYTAAEMEGSGHATQLHLEDEVAARATELGVTAGLAVFTTNVPAGGAETSAWTYRRKDGSTLRVRLTVTRMLDSADQPIGWIGVARDITEEELALRRLEIAERRWRTLLENLPDLTVLVVGPDLRYRVAIGAAIRHHPHGPVEGKSLFETSNAHNIALLEPLYRNALAGRSGYAETQASERDTLHEVTVVPLPQLNGEPEALVLTRDVTYKRREAEVRAARDRFVQLFTEAPHGTVLLSAAGTITEVNPAVTQLLYRSEAELIGMRLDRDPLNVVGSQQLNDLLAGRMPRLSVEASIFRATGDPLYVAASLVPLRSVGGTIDAILLTLVDLSERRRYEQQLARLAETDPLTGVANRRKFDAELQSHLERCRRYGGGGALLLLDLDNFKQVNDTLGHGVGDQLIVSVADLLRNRARSSDVVARLGGDEFAILLPFTERPGAEAVAQSILDLVRTSVSVQDSTRRRSVTASIGVVLIQDTNLTAAELLSSADMTMYDAKEAGRDRFVVLDVTEHLVPRTSARIAWADRIVRALDENRVVVHAQPILDLANDRITAAELFIRLVDENGELVMPGRFLYIAERNGQIADIDALMLGKAVDVLEHLRVSNPDIEIAVNLSGKSIGDRRVSELIATLVAERDFDPSRLVLEITETAAVSNIEAARRFAEEVGALGCRFALDDFGTGFGSFYYLKHLVFDYVKIDGEFVANLPDNPTDRLIVSSIVEVARGLGKQTIAEFVASEEIIDVVRELGVDYAQGYHIARPQSLESFYALLAEIRLAELELDQLEPESLES